MGVLDAFTAGIGRVPLVGRIFDPAKADLSGVQKAQQSAFDTKQGLADERAGFAGNYRPGRERELSRQQGDALGMVRDAAMGTAPSAAELMLRRNADTNAARAFGMGAALQGRSPGMALQTAQGAATQIQADAARDAAVQRAAEQAQARQLLVQGLAGVRGQEQGLAGLDLDWRKALLAGELGALGSGVTAAGAAADASAKSAAGENAMAGSLLGAAGNILARKFGGP